MLLAIDIGNTTTSFGAFQRGRLIAQFAMATQAGRRPGETGRRLKTLAKSHGLRAGKVNRIMVCSVVPSMTAVLTRVFGKLLSVPVGVVGRDVLVPLKNRYRYPEQVGQDRLVGAYAAWRRFKGACVVADFGTAITIDVVTKDAEYLGGIIAPGLEISLEVLAARTALLPKVELSKPRELLGRDTTGSIQSGVIYGAAALCDGLAEALRTRYAPTAIVVATGGASPLISRYSRVIDHVRPRLVLEGLLALSAPASMTE